MEFNYVRLRLTVATDHPHGLIKRWYGCAPAFSTAVRNRACLSGNTVCAACRVSATCAYHTIFGQDLTPDPVALKRFQKPPLPFVFTFPAAGHAERKQRCDLVLVGSAINHLRLFVDAFGDMLAHFGDEADDAPHRLVCIESLDYDGAAHQLSDGGQLAHAGDVAVLDAAELLRSRARPPGRFGIALVTPVRLVGDGKVLRDFDVSRFLRTLLRRVSAMAYYYCGWEMDLDFRRCAVGAGEVVALSHQFRFVAAHEQFATSGVAGSGVFSGCPEELWPFLLMGELLHVGKGASFGMGCYSVVGMEYPEK